MNSWLGIGLVLAALGGLLGGLRLYQWLGPPHPELLRKLLHMGMGLVTLSFPWMFEEAWPVVGLAVMSIGLLLSLRMVRFLKESLGTVVGGVGRLSLGEVYFPVSVSIVFLLYLNEDEDDHGRRLVLYCIPVLLLTLADAAAALIGIRYGRLLYPTPDGEKSAEGSLAFFALAFFCVHIPLLAHTDTGRMETLLIAVLLAWLATMFEAIAWRGLDNLILPLVSFLLLKIYLGLGVEDLTARLVVTAVLMAFLVVYRHQSTLAGSALLGAYLLGYVSWALGGWRWLLPPLILFVTYTLLSPRTEANSKRHHNIHAVVCVASGLVWLFLAKVEDRPEFLFPYTLSFAAHLAMIGVARLGFDFPWMSGPGLLSIAILKSWLLLFVPYLLAEWFTLGITGMTIEFTLVGLAGVALAALGFYWLQPEIHNCPADTPRWLRQATLASLASAMGLVPLYLI